MVEGYQAKDGALRANGRDITFADGTKLFVGSSGTGAPRDGRDPREVDGRRADRRTVVAPAHVVSSFAAGIRNSTGDPAAVAYHRPAERGATHYRIAIESWTDLALAD